MPLTAQDIIDRARNQLQDVDGIAGITPRYSESDMLSFITLGQRAIVRVKPSAYSGLSTHTCTAAPRQRLDPTVFHSILRVMWNDEDPLNFNGVGAAIQTVERDVFDTFYSMWPVSTAVAGEAPTRFKAACLDAKDPLAFWLFPTPRLNDVVVITASLIPEDRVDVLDDILVGNEYAAPLVDFVCHMAALSVGRDEAAQHAERYLVRFLGALGVSTATIQEVSTNQPAAPEATE